MRRNLKVLSVVAMASLAITITASFAMAIPSLRTVSSEYVIPRIYNLKTINPNSDDYQDYMYLVKNGIIPFTEDTTINVTEESLERMVAYEVDRRLGTLNTVGNTRKGSFQVPAEVRGVFTEEKLQKLKGLK